MAEREPTVIERMRWAYIHAITAEIDSGNKDYDDACRKAMLAAVRELQATFKGEPAEILMQVVIDEHHRGTADDSSG